MKIERYAEDLITFHFEIDPDRSLVVVVEDFVTKPENEKPDQLKSAQAVHKKTGRRKSRKHTPVDEASLPDGHVTQNDDLGHTDHVRTVQRIRDLGGAKLARLLRKFLLGNTVRGAVGVVRRRYDGQLATNAAFRCVRSGHHSYFVLGTVT